MIKKSRQAVGYGYNSLLTTYNTNRTMNPLDYNEAEMGEIVLKNLRDFRTLIKYNVHSGMYIYKMDGDIIPMASHPFNLYDWKGKQKHIFESIGKWIDGERARLVIFPNKQVRLGQIEDTDVLNDLAYLRYYIELLDMMKLDTTNKVVITIGQYEDQQYSYERFVRNFFRLPKNIRDRLVLTNESDGRFVQETIEVCQSISIPFMFSYYNQGDMSRLSSMLEGCFYEMKESWKTVDGNPIVHIVEPPCQTQEAFYKLLSYEEFGAFDRKIYRNNLSIIYDSSFKDIAATKLANYITQEKGVFLKDKCVDEWQRYRYLVMAHDPDAFIELQRFMEEVKDFKTFYVKIEKVMAKFKLMPNDLFAAEELLLDMSANIKQSEKEEGMTLLRNRDMNGFKHYCHQLAQDYNLTQFISNYYFHLG